MSWCHQIPKLETRKHILLNNFGNKHSLVMDSLGNITKEKFLSKNSQKHLNCKLVPGPF